MLFRHPPLKFRSSTHGLSGAGVKAKDINHSDCFASIHRRGRYRTGEHPYRVAISPVAIRITFTALPITSAGRFSPLGPLGIGLLLGALDAQSLAGNLPFGISLDASALLVGLREASLGLGDYLAIWGGWLMVSLLTIGHARLASWPLGHGSISGRVVTEQSFNLGKTFF